MENFDAKTLGKALKEYDAVNKELTKALAEYDASYAEDTRKGKQKKKPPPPAFQKEATRQAVEEEAAAATGAAATAQKKHTKRPEKSQDKTGKSDSLKKSINKIIIDAAANQRIPFLNLYGYLFN